MKNNNRNSIIWFEFLDVIAKTNYEQGSLFIIACAIRGTIDVSRTVVFKISEVKVIIMIIILEW